MKNQTRINNQIRALEVRVIDDKKNNLGIMKTIDALNLAKEKQLDLVEISPTAKPPVVRIIDYGKYQYQENKNLRKAARKQKEVGTKGLRIGIGTSQHDLQLKAEKAQEWLVGGSTVQIELRLRGREKGSQKIFIEERLNRFLTCLTEPYKITQPLKKARGGYMLVIDRQR